jgi:RNA polymerase sigma-70 factor (ECF subfamily)
MKKANQLEQWVEDYSQEMVSWAAHKVSDSDLAKDLVQDTFLAAFEKMDTFQGKSSPKTWLFSILNYKIIDHYRAKVRQPIRIENTTLSTYFKGDGEWLSDKKPTKWDDEEGHLLDNDDFNEVLQKCIEALPDKWGAIVKLKYLMNKKGNAICQELGITPTNLWQIMHRSKLKLRECIDGNWFQED